MEYKAISYIQLHVLCVSKDIEVQLRLDGLEYLESNMLRACCICGRID